VEKHGIPAAGNGLYPNVFYQRYIPGKRDTGIIAKVLFSRYSRIVITDSDTLCRIGKQPVFVGKSHQRLPRNLGCLRIGAGTTCEQYPHVFNLSHFRFHSNYLLYDIMSGIRKKCFTLTFAELAGAHTEPLPESAGKCGRCLIPHSQRRICYTVGGRGDPQSGPLQTKAAYMTIHRLPHKGAENTVKVKRRKTSDSGQTVNGERFVKILADMDQYPVQPLLVTVQRCRAHTLFLLANVCTIASA